MVFEERKASSFRRRPETPAVAETAIRDDDSPPGRMDEALRGALTARGTRHGGGSGPPGGRNRSDRGRSNPHRGPESPSAALPATARGDRSGPHAASSSNSAGGR